ncbi:superoxide dismutase [Vibrio cincinnatiensis]|nr:superoxide dismutase [Vibrio cincinnatiensis]
MAVSLRSSIAKRRSHLNAALTGNEITHLFPLNSNLLIYINNKSSKK